MLQRIWNLVLKEFIQFARDWLMTTFILTLPILQLILLAQATSSRISDLCVAVLDFDRSGGSRQLAAALDNRRELWRSLCLDRLLACSIQQDCSRSLRGCPIPTL